MAIWNASVWNYRTTDTRIVVVKGKNLKNHKIVVEDVDTKLPFALEISANVPVHKIKVGKEYTATVKIFTARSIKDLEKEFIELFEVLDVDQPTEAFLTASCSHQALIRFELTEIETT
jgi:hypothetical protein